MAEAREVLESKWLDCVCKKSQFNGKRILLSGNCRTKWRKPQRAMNLLAKIAGPAVAKSKSRGKRNTRFN
jgi:hypothetical protein